MRKSEIYIFVFFNYLINDYGRPGAPGGDLGYRSTGLITFLSGDSSLLFLFSTIPLKKRIESSFASRMKSTQGNQSISQK